MDLEIDHSLKSLYSIKQIIEEYNCSLGLFISQNAQLRLRHLTGILGRNFKISDKDICHKNTSVYLALSFPSGDTIGYFYRSDAVNNPSNPTWEVLDLIDCSSSHLSSKSVIITIFITSGKLDNRILFELEVHFSGLLCVGHEIPDTLPTFVNKENLIVFQFGDKLYVHGDPTHSSKSEECFPTFESTFFRVDTHLVKPTYDLNTLTRLNTLVKILFNKKNNIHQLKEAVDSQEYNLKNVILVKSEVEDKTTSIDALRLRIKETQSRLAKMRQQLRKCQEANCLTNNQFENLQSLKANCLKETKHTRETITSLKSDYHRLYLGLLNRKRFMIKELVDIFPITSPNTAAQQPVVSLATSPLYICGVHLPNSNNRGEVVGLDDKSLGASLGMIAHLLWLLATVCDVPLRYPVKLNGSKCAIRDNVVPGVPDAEREFPLYLKDSTSVRLKYGLYLMNLNIMTLRGFFGMPTSNLRATLYNIKTLIEVRLLGKKAPTMNILPTSQITNDSTQFPNLSNQQIGQQTSSTTTLCANKNLSGVSLAGLSNSQSSPNLAGSNNPSGGTVKVFQSQALMENTNSGSTGQIAN